MKLSILGASGGCGVQLVTQAVARGHTVKAVVRSSSYQAPPGVEVLRGDLTDAGFLTRAIQGAGGVGDSEAMVPLAFRLFIKATSIRHAYAELARMEAGLLASGLEVCICRPTGLTDGPLTGKAVLATGFTGRATISRADVAHWMLDQLERPAFDQRTPMITVTGAAG